MLVTVPPPALSPLFAAAHRGMPATEVMRGVAVARGFDYVYHLRAHITDAYPRLRTGNPYGVADSPEQIPERLALEDDPRPLVVLCTEVVRDHQPASGGWKWHKWGAYIGDFEPAREYLYDEPDIERVFVYRIVEVVDTAPEPL